MKERCPKCKDGFINSPIEKMLGICCGCIKKTVDTNNQIEILLLSLKPIFLLQTKVRTLAVASEHLCNLIHEDIFHKEPRGQVSEGQEVRWHRCLDILKAKDKVTATLNVLTRRINND